MKIIGINGLKRSGKNTAYDFALDILFDGQSVIKEVGFAHKLKVYAMQSLGFDRPDAELIDLANSIKDGAPITVLYDDPEDDDLRVDQPHADLARLHQWDGRSYLQHMGTRARDLFGANFWVDQVLPKRTVPVDLESMSGGGIALADGRYDGVDYLFITDVRFPNEADRIKALGGIIWEVIRPGIESDGHASEQPLPEELIDWQIRNDGTLETLYDRVAEAVRETL